MSTPDRFAAGAVDLGQIKARAEARTQAPQPGQGQTPGGQPGMPPAGAGQPEQISTFFTVTGENLETEVVHRSMQIPVVVLIGTSRSPDSEQLKTDLEQLARESDLKFVVGYVDADTTPDIAQAMGVSGLPTVLALAAGQPITNFQGGQPMDALKQWTTSLIEAVGGQLQGLPAGTVAAGDEPQPAPEPPSDPRYDAATEALNAGDFDAAIKVYEQILATEPKNQEAKQARDNARLLGRLSKAAPGEDPVAAAESAPGDIDKAFAAADHLIAGGDPEGAFDRLISLLSTTAGEEKTRIRERLVELFALFETTDPRVVAARGRMASALY